MIKDIKLTPEILERYGNRKEEGRIDFVVDVENRIFYAVPRGFEHEDFTPYLKGDHEKLIPVQFRFRGKTLVDIITGASSFEAKYGVRHEQKDLTLAHKLAIELASYSNLDINLKRNEILHIYQKRLSFLN